MRTRWYAPYIASFLLVVACFMVAIPQSRAVPYVGNLTFNTQAQIDAFSNTYTSLTEDIQGLNLTSGVKNSLIVKLNNAQSSYCVNGNSNAAINQLNSFINQVETKRGNPLTNEEADDLIARANLLIAAIQNGTVDCGGGAKPGKNNGVTGIADLPELELFPNPAGTEVNIRMNGLENNGTVTIFNQLGSAVWQQPVEEGMTALKVNLADNAFAPGVYLVSLRIESEVINRRLVVAK